MPLDQHRILYLFPGQGSQYTGMGSDLCRDYAVARRRYDQASGVLGYDLAELSFQGPDEQLTLTRFTQPALLTHAIACLDIFQELTDGQVTPQLAAGHSLGEYTALVAAGALNFEQALRLVQQRGECMGTYGEGEMAALPLELAAVRLLAEQHYCGIAACNLPDQTVVGGRREDLDVLLAVVQERFPRKRPVRLKTEGAFHTYFMVDAARHFRPFLDAAELAPPTRRVLSNYSGDYHDDDPAAIKARLFFQLFHPVLWYANLQRALADGVTLCLEFGGGLGSGDTPDAKRPTLEGMLKKAQRGSEAAAAYLPAINSPTLAASAASLREQLG